MSENSELVRKATRPGIGTIGTRGSKRSTRMWNSMLRAFGPTSTRSTGGHEGLAEFWRRMHEAWDEFRIDIERMDEARDRFVLA
jgi:hypothetical protein